MVLVSVDKNSVESGINNNLLRQFELNADKMVRNFRREVRPMKTGALRS